MRASFNVLSYLLPLWGLIVAWENPAVFAKEFDLGLQSSTRIQEITGAYEGEVRLQSSNGQTDRLLNSSVIVQVALTPDSIQFKSKSDLIGTKCHSQIGAIRELKKFGNDQSQILTAEFSFAPGKCLGGSYINNMTLLFWKNDKNEVILETILDHFSDHLDFKPKHELYVHGYFTKSTSPLTKPVSKTVANVAS